MVVTILTTHIIGGLALGVWRVFLFFPIVFALIWLACNLLGIRTPVCSPGVCWVAAHKDILCDTIVTLSKYSLTPCIQKTASVFQHVK